MLLDPLDFIARLVALIPPPRFHLLRYHGVLAAHAIARSEVVPGPAPALAEPRQLKLLFDGEATELEPGSKVRCWGANHYGQLGYGNTEDIGDDELPSSAGDVNVGGTVVQLDTGEFHTCVVLDTNKVRCWGGGHFGQIGYGSTNNVGDDEPPVSAGDVNLGIPVLDLAADQNHNCVRVNQHAVRCWGEGGYGQLGLGMPVDYIGDDEYPWTPSVLVF